MSHPLFAWAPATHLATSAVTSQLRTTLAITPVSVAAVAAVLAVPPGAAQELTPSRRDQLTPLDDEPVPSVQGSRSAWAPYFRERLPLVEIAISRFAAETGAQAGTPERSN